MLEYKYISQIKYTEAILSNSTRKLLWFEVTRMLIAVKKRNKFFVSFIMIFGTLLFAIVRTFGISWRQMSRHIYHLATSPVCI